MLTFERLYIILLIDKRVSRIIYSKKIGGKIMNTILLISLLSILSSLAIAYVSFIFAKSEEAKIVNEIQIKYPNTMYYG
ncbi:MAG: hypothetical protein IJI80_05125 [Methanobrevibacter sp.]|uniref:hypothetical protein n=1 Tax=Methanobrevibacter sp. TaxID=66852 RepID=UPI0025D09DB4|nr:hypothetical protein [Methanobrevibacter sp.]MBQ6139041.1 hypothetical protein [Methanobrevibacter sp.]